MTQGGIGSLISESIFEPRRVAARLIQIDLPRSLLWEALVAVIALNVVVFWLAHMAFDVNDPLPAMMSTPFRLALTLGGGVALSVFAFTWTGNMIGGRAGLDEMLVLTIWCQVLRLMFQIVTIAVTWVVPVAVPVLIFGMSLLGLWVLVNFIDVAHGFASRPKALGVLFLSLIGSVVGLSMMLTIIGLLVPGVFTDV